LGFEELHEHGSEDRRIDVVLLTFQGVVLPLRNRSLK
jgi:hypothetical protein